MEERGEKMCSGNSQTEVSKSIKAEEVSIYNCGCFDPTCRVILTKYEDCRVLSFPLCISPDVTGRFRKLIMLDRDFEYGNIFFYNDIKAVTKEGLPLEGEISSREDALAQLVHRQLMKEQAGEPSYKTAKTLRCNGVTAWELYTSGESTDIMRLRRIRSPLKIIKAIMEWASLPLFIFSRICAIIYAGYTAVPDCFLNDEDRDALRKKLSEYGMQENIFSKFSKEDEEEKNLFKDYLISLPLAKRLEVILTGLVIEEAYIVQETNGKELESRLYLR